MFGRTVTNCSENVPNPDPTRPLYKRSGHQSDPQVLKKMGKSFQSIVAFCYARGPQHLIERLEEILITETQAKILAAALHEIRPAWSVPSMMTLLGKNKDHAANFADTLAAAIAAARDHAVTTPALIFIDQRFWPEEVKKRLPKPPECPDHVGQDGHNCSSCWADVKTGDRPENMIGKHWQPITNHPEALADAGASLI